MVAVNVCTSWMACKDFSHFSAFKIVAEWNWCRVFISFSYSFPFVSHRWALCCLWEMTHLRLFVVLELTISHFHQKPRKSGNFFPQISLEIVSMIGEEGIDYGGAICHISLTMLTRSNASDHIGMSDASRVFSVMNFQMKNMSRYRWHVKVIYKW